MRECRSHSCPQRINDKDTIAAQKIVLENSASLRQIGF